jgi:hypothetical protein
MKTTRYIVVRQDSFEELEMVVSAYMAPSQGYVPVGGVAVDRQTYVGFDEAPAVYAQAMMLKTYA